MKSIHALVTNLHSVAVRVVADNPEGFATRAEFVVLNARTAEEAVAECRRAVGESQPGWEFEDLGVYPIREEIELLLVTAIPGPVDIKYRNVVICRPYLGAPQFDDGVR